jgi:site-specific DNA recombinase
MTLAHTLADATRLRPGRRLVFAGRVSDEDDEDKSYGLQIQEDDVRAFAQADDWDLILDPAYSGYESGRIPLHMRAIYQRILRDARQGHFDAVCFGRINRIARRSYFSLQLIEELKEVGVDVLTADLRIDTRTPAGEYVRQIMIATAEFDASSILRNTAAGRAKRLASGVPWLSRHHYGYRYTRPSSLGKRDGQVNICVAEAARITWDVAEVCRRLSKGAYHADEAGKRTLLETAQLRIWVRGREWWATGMLPGLHLEGMLTPGSRVLTESPPCRDSPHAPLVSSCTGSTERPFGPAVPRADQT